MAINQRGAAPILILVAVIGLVAFLAISSSAPFKNILLSTLFPKDQSHAASTSYYEPFSGVPAAPERFDNDNPAAAHLDVVPNESDAGAVGSDQNGSFEEVDVHHGPGCEAPVTNDTPSATLVMHRILRIDDAVYRCKDHIMTGLLSGYAAAYLTPDAMVDFSQGEAVIRFDVSSLRTSGRDWIDMWLTPFNDKFVIPLERWNAPYNGEPKNAVHIRADGNNDGSYHFEGTIYRNNVEEGMNSGPGTLFEGVKTAFANSGAVKTVTINGTPTTIPVDMSPKRRDTYELRISKTSAKFCLVQVNVQMEDSTKQPVQTQQCWINSTFNNLGWDKAIVQFGHHAYNPEKDCTPDPLSTPAIQMGCRAVTWHWDEFKINPAIPFALIKPTPSSPKFITRNSSITLNSPTPPNSYLSFVAVAGSVEGSFDNGVTWVNFPRQFQVRNSPEHFSNYFVPIPAGVQTIKFRGADAASWLARFVVEHPAVYSLSDPALVSPIPSPTPTPTPTPFPPTAFTVDFNNQAAGDLSGEYPIGAINWQSGPWSISAPWKGLTTNNLGLRSATTTSGSFTFMTPRTVTSIQAFNGGTVDSTVTLSCSGNTTKTQVVTVNTLTTITTGWTNPCTTVTLNSSNGWNTNFDNLAVGATSGSSSPAPSVAPSPTPPPPSPSPSASPSPALSPSPSPAKPGDIDGNNKVDIFDYNILLTNFGKTGSGIQGDFDNNGKVDIFDFNTLLSNFGK